MTYYNNRETAVQYVAERLRLSKPGSVLTMIIGVDKSGDFYAHTATDIQSEDIAEKPYKLSMIISPDNTLDG